ncbi:MAG TPA: ACT domain-containing protein [Bacillota bacterium]|nr:ACT domain-containing protein [Bacillota bacterium]
MADKEHVVITVTGHDRVGIVAGVSKVLADYNLNIVDISQTILNDIFAMILLVDISQSQYNLADLEEPLKIAAEAIGVKIVIQHEDIFRYMHRI